MTDKSGTDNKWTGVLTSLPEFDLIPGETGLVIIDMDYRDVSRDHGAGAQAKKVGADEEFEYYFSRIEDVVVPNIKRMQDVCRESGIELIFVRISSLVNDLRDMAPIYKRLGIGDPIGSRETEILDELKPTANEVVVTKMCSGAFNGSNIDNILNNMGIKNLIFCGVNTNYCVETSVRSAGDRDYNVILLSDGCAAWTAEEDAYAMTTLNDVYCKVKTTDEVISLIRNRAS